MTLRPRYLRERRPTRKPGWPPLPPPPHQVTYVSIEQELPGMEDIERVPLPFDKQPPQYRVEYTAELRGYLTFTTGEDPEEWLESDDNVEPLIDHFFAREDYEVDPFGRGVDGPVEQLHEDGTWGPVDWDAVHAREEEDDDRYLR